MDWKQYYIQGLELVYLCIGTYFDVKDQELPVSFLRFFVMAAVFCNIFGTYQNSAEIFAGVIVGGVFLLICWLSREALGYGDGIALVTLGIFEGGSQLVPIVFWAFLLSSIYGGWKLIGLKREKTDTMPFFPFLLMAFVGVEIL